MPSTNKENDKIANLQLSLEELRLKYSEISHSYDAVRVKVLALIAVELTIVTFLFASVDSLPKFLYGLIFYFSGVICLGASFSFLIKCVRGVQWRMPSDRHDLKTMLDENYSKKKFLEKVEQSYREALDEDLPKLASKGADFDKALILLVVGVIILVVLKYGKVMVL